MSENDYPFTVRPLTAEDGGGYLIEFPDLPGCVSDGETVAEAIANGMDAKAAWLAAMREAGLYRRRQRAGRSATLASGNCARHAPCIGPWWSGRSRTG